jgi:hypothetical protein
MGGTVGRQAVVELRNIVTLPEAEEGQPRSTGIIMTTVSATAAPVDVPLYIYNATPFALNGFSIASTPVSGVPLAGMSTAEQIASPLTGKLDIGNTSLLQADFPGKTWTASLVPLGGVPRWFYIFCFWNGFVVFDFNGSMRNITWQ